MLGLDRELIDWLEWTLVLDTDGGSGDWTTFNDEESSSFGGRGRKMRIGTFRNGWESGGRRVAEIR